MPFNNAQVAKLLREIAAIYHLKAATSFQARAYESAADAIEHSTSEIKDLWEEGSLDRIPGLGESLKAHLNELFSTGLVKKWDKLKKGYPEGFFQFLDLPGVGPKTALELSKLDVKDIADLENQIKTGQLIKKGFSAKIAEKLITSIQQSTSVKTGRMLLPYAYDQAQKILDYLSKNADVKRTDALGSLRRMVATIGDLDFGIASDRPERVVEYLFKMSGVSRVVDRGDKKVTLMLHSGLHVDFLIVSPDRYGALLQHFTGSKHHNIHLRSLAEKQGYSLSEEGVKVLKTGQLIQIKDESQIYQMLGMQTPPPELREDTGEIEQALAHKLPQVVAVNDIKGDLHTHSNFPIESSHGPGADHLKEIIAKAHNLKYSYIGISDHSPSFTTHSSQQVIDLIKARTEDIEHLKSNSKIRVLNLLEVDILPVGTLSVPEEGLKLLDFAIGGIHTSHNMAKDEMTKRILKALSNPYLKVLAHPTGRLLNEREGYDADWDAIFDYAARHKIAIEIDSYPNRLDLSESLVRKALEHKVKLVIDTDAHAVSQMDNMKFGVDVARRGWATPADIVNCWDWDKFASWFGLT